MRYELYHHQSGQVHPVRFTRYVDAFNCRSALGPGWSIRDNIKPVKPTSDTPRTDALLAGEYATFRIAGLAMQLERELRIQTDLVNHYRELLASLPANTITNTNPVD